MKRIYLSGDRDEHEAVLRRCRVPVTEEAAGLLRDVLRKHLDLPSAVDRSHKPPHAHQKKIVRAMRDSRGLIVFHKVGSGKTLTAILVSQDYLDRFPWKRVVVITPAGLLSNFRDEMRKSFKNLLYEDRYEFFSYHAFVNRCKDDELFCHRCTDTLLIVDEAHNLRHIYHARKNKKTKKVKEYGVMNRWITRCAERADRVLLLTGTPVYNHPNDIAALYNMIREANERPFRYSYDQQDLFDYGLLDQRVSLYEPPVEAGDYPRRVDHLVPIVMNDDFLRRYEELLENLEPGERPEYLSRLFGDETNLEPFFNGVRRGVNNLEDERSAKIQWVVQKILDPATPGPILVFSAWLNAGNRIVANILEHSLFNGKPVRYRVIEGDVPMKDRRGIVSRYNHGRTRVLFLSKAGGEGLDLRNTRTVIIMEESWNRASQEQVIGRAIRYRSHHGLPEDQRRVDVYILNHLRPTDMDYRDKVRAWLNDGGGYSFLGFPVDLEMISIDFALRAYHKKKKKVLDGFVRRLRELSYRGRVAAEEARERREQERLERERQERERRERERQERERRKQERKERERRERERKRQERRERERKRQERPEARATESGLRERIRALRFASVSAAVYDESTRLTKELDDDIIRFYREMIGSVPADPFTFAAASWPSLVEKVCPRSRKCRLLLQSYLGLYPVPLYPLLMENAKKSVLVRSQAPDVIGHLSAMADRIRALYRERHGVPFPE